MARRPDLHSFSRAGDGFGDDLLDRDGHGRTFSTPCDLGFAFDGGSAYLTHSLDGTCANLVIRGDVPEIPDIENLGDTGWVFRHVVHRRGRFACSSTIVFEIPEGGERHIAQMLGYYTLLYAS